MGSLHENNEKICGNTGFNPQMLNIIPNPMFYKDTKGKYLWCNKGFAEAIGLVKEELIGKTDYEITTREIADFFTKTDAGIIETKIGNSYETSILHADGFMYDTIVSRTPYLDCEGKVVGIVGIVTDITKQKQIEKELKTSQNEMKKLIKNRKEAEKKLIEKLSFEEILINMSARFVAEKFNERIVNKALEDMGNLSRADRVYIFINNYEKRTTSNIFEWCAKDIESQMGFLQDIPFDTIPWWIYKNIRGETINISDVSCMPMEASKEKEILEVQDIKSILVLPMHGRSEVVGFIGFDSVKQIKTWEENNLLLLKLSSEIIGNAFEREKNEKSLIDSEEKYRELFNNVNSCIFVNKVTEDYMIGEFLEVNNLASEKLGYTKDEFKNLNFLDLLDYKFKATYMEKINKSLTDSNLIIEMNIKDKEGSVIPFEISLHIFNLQDEKVILSVANDISKRKEASEKIKELLLAIENSPSSVVITNVKGEIEYVNPKFTDLTGYTEDEIKGKTVGLLKSGYHEKKYYFELWKSILSGKEWRGEFYNRRKDGSYYWEYTSIAPLKDEEGKITHFISVREDVSQRKIMEEDLKKNNKELKETINKLKITQAQLIQQEKLAGIGQLAAGVAHEINNPLGFVSSNFEMLKKYTENLKNTIYGYKKLVEKIKIRDTELIEVYLQEIKEIEKENKLDYILSDLEGLFDESEEGIERVNSIVKGLKWFAYEDSSNQFEMYDLNLGIKNTLIVAKNEIKYIAKVIEEYDEIPLVQASRQKINQVLLNIILNAVYAIKEKGSDEFGIITIKTYEDGKYVYCEIKDNGTGIKEEAISKIFEPFYTTKPAGKGTGLGLNIAYDIIVNIHNGAIECKNNKEGGACFILKLPINQRQ